MGNLKMHLIPAINSLISWRFRSGYTYPAAHPEVWSVSTVVRLVLLLDGGAELDEACFAMVVVDDSPHSCLHVLELFFLVREWYQKGRPKGQRRRGVGPRGISPRAHL